jgi:hypothetical protein
MKIIYFIILFFVAMAISISATSFSIQSSSIKGYSIDYFDGNYYIVCQNCSSVGVNSGLDKYNINSGSHTDFGSVYPNGSLSLGYLGLGGQIDPIFPHRVFYGDQWQFISVRNASVQAGETLYKYNNVLGQWQQLFTVTATNYYFRGYDIEDSAYKGNYNGIFYTTISSTWYINRLLWNTTSNSVTFPASFSTGISSSSPIRSPTPHREHITTSSRIIGLNNLYDLNYNRTLIKPYGDSPSGFWNNAWVSSDNQNIIYLYDADVYYTINGNASISKSTSWSNFSNCADIDTLTGIQLYDIDCSNQNDCVIVGQYGTAGDIHPLAFQFSEYAGCSNIDLNSNSVFSDSIGKSLFSIIYNSDDNEFGVVGNGTLLSIITNPIAGFPVLPICIDYYYLCDNPISVGFSNTTWYCPNSDDATFCSGGCVNSLSGAEMYGTCTQSTTCNNECIFNNIATNIEGHRGCTSTNSYSICGFFDSDPCLELSTPYLCGSGKYCNEGNCLNYDNTSASANLITYPDFTVLVQTIGCRPANFWGSPDDDKILSEDSDCRTLGIFNGQTNTFNIVNPFNTFLSRFIYGTVHAKPITGTTQQTYTAYNCDYKETITYQNNFINDSYSVLSFTPLLRDLIIKFSVFTNNVTDIYIKDSLNNTVIHFTQTQNTSFNENCIYVDDYYVPGEEKSLLYCGASDKTFYDLVYDYNTGTYTIHNVLQAGNVIEKFSRPLPVLSNTGISSIIISSNNYSEITDLKLITINQISGQTSFPLYSITRSDFSSINCEYNNDGCYDLRTYLSFDNINTYQKYKTFKVCLSNFIDGNDIIGEGEAADFINSIPISWRYLIMVIAVIIFFIIPLILAGGDGAIASLALSSLISLTLSIIFGLSLLIPIIYIIISGGLIALLIRKVSTG